MPDRMILDQKLRRQRSIAVQRNKRSPIQLFIREPAHSLRGGMAIPAKKIDSLRLPHRRMFGACFAFISATAAHVIPEMARPAATSVAR